MNKIEKTTSTTVPLRTQRVTEENRVPREGTPVKVKPSKVK